MSYSGISQENTSLYHSDFLSGTNYKITLKKTGFKNLWYRDNDEDFYILTDDGFDILNRSFKNKLLTHNYLM